MDESFKQHLSGMGLHVLIISSRREGTWKEHTGRSRSLDKQPGARQGASLKNVKSMFQPLNPFSRERQTEVRPVENDFRSGRRFRSTDFQWRQTLYIMAAVKTAPSETRHTSRGVRYKTKLSPKAE